MIKVTTTSPYSMFSFGNEESPLINTDGYKGFSNIPEWAKSHNFIGSVYLHGDVQHKAGFDIPIFLDGDFPLKDGVYDCIALVPDEVKCKMYVWFRGIVPGRRMMGLIVDINDSESIKYAETCMIDKPSIL